MGKYLQSFSILCLGICILLGSIIISKSLKSETSNAEVVKNDENRYDFITIADDYYIIFDKRNGKFWKKIGSSEWEEQQTFPQ